ncbi:synemin [Periophthalmus magnuspinnatus]|uniref:synemin n=1 Tax=Periophthalmus magnuspinnatus TaxID=409849 RepID=UPI00145A9DC4|nr:synemin [Periophthalmus magnuspinnatus]
MLPFTRTFEPEKRQLQELNCRLAQYLNRTKQLEQENASLIREISELRQAKSAQWEPQYKAEMRDLRRTMERLSLERSQAEMEREKIWRELQTVQALCSEQTGVCRDISGELRGCEKELTMAHKTNGELQQKLVQLQEECRRLEEAHKQEILRLRHQVETRMTPSHYMRIQSSHGPLLPPVTVEDVQDYAFGLSEGWVKTFDMYQQKVEEMEKAIREDQARMCDLQREKEMYATQLERIRAQAEHQGQEQMRLEQEMVSMQEKFHLDCEEYQMVIDQLQRERDLMAHNMEQKMVEHQQLLQLKMDLGLELAAYRALLEGERVNLEESHRRANQSRERVIEIKMPPQPYSPRTPSSSTRLHTDFRPSPAASSYRRPPVPRPSSGAISPSRIVPISVTRNQSPAARRDMISFTKARAAQSSTSTTPYTTKNIQPEEITGPKVSIPTHQSSKTHTETKVTASKRNVSESREERKAFDNSLTNGGSMQPSTKKILDTVSVEEMIEKAIKPEGSEAPGETKVRYHVEKTQEEDGTMKTRIVLESKVEEELDVSKDSDLEELLHQGTKKMSLEDIKDTATASMIKNLLSGMKGGEDLGNKSINVEIIEEPVEGLSDDEEEPEIKKLQTSYQEQVSTYFQIEELENAPTKATNEQWKEGLGQVEEVSRESDSSFMSQDKEHREYFVSTPDEFSEPEEGGGITSYGHYGIVDDLSDERYYQDELLPLRATPDEGKEYKYMTGDRPSFKEGFPECIIEEEVRVSPVVQSSVLEFLREDSLEPKEQLKGALEQLQESVSGPLKEELAYLTKLSRESPDKVDVRKVSQSSDDGTMTIVAELNVSQTLEESGLLDESGDLSDEHIMAALRGAGLEKAFQSGAGGGYSIKVSTEEEEHGFGDISEKDIMEKLMRGEMSHSYEVQGGSEDEAAGGVVKEQRIVYLESPSDD